MNKINQQLLDKLQNEGARKDFFKFQEFNITDNKNDYKIKKDKKMEELKEMYKDGIYVPRKVINERGDYH